VTIDRTACGAGRGHLITYGRIRQEGVGLLSGPLDAPVRAAPGQLDNVTATYWTPLANVAEFPRVRYEVDPETLLAAYNELEAEGLRPAVLVHSHLTGGAAPSSADVRYASDPALLNMIVDLEPQRPHAVLWRLTPGTDPLKIRYQVADLRKQESSATDLTRDVSGG
jgi:proteasome lid subunit RPN8/RPN11